MTMTRNLARAVIASEAKQSIVPHRMDCFVASLPCANASRLSQPMTNSNGNAKGAEHYS